MTLQHTIGHAVTQGEEVARFWAKVDRREDGECWPWTGVVSDYGYGRFYTGRKFVPASRTSWELANGVRFPVGKLACHTCDNPICVNPRHIWPGTQSENIKDCVAKGRHKSKPAKICKRGHILEGANSVPIKNGHHRCRECQRVATRAAMRAMRARRRAAEHA